MRTKQLGFLPVILFGVGLSIANGMGCAASTNSTGFTPADDGGTSATGDDGSSSSTTPTGTTTGTPTGTATTPTGTTTGTTPPPPPGDDGGTAPPPDNTMCPLGTNPKELIDDQASMTSAGIILQCGRVGYWYTFNDGLAGTTQTPAQMTTFKYTAGAGPNGETQVAQTTGTTSSAAKAYGAGLGFNLNTTGTLKNPYNGSTYSGFSFYIKVGATNTASPITFKVQTQAVDPMSGADFAYNITAPVTGTWTKVTVPYAMLKQPSWTPPAAMTTFDPTMLIGLQWQAPAGVTFDISISDVSFVN